MESFLLIVGKSVSKLILRSGPQFDRPAFGELFARALRLRIAEANPRLLFFLESGAAFFVQSGAQLRVVGVEIRIEVRACRVLLVLRNLPRLQQFKMRLVS